MSNDNTQIQSENLHTLAKVAWMYYIENFNQQEIGERLGISRITIGRILQKARSEGIVEFRVRAPGVAFIELEQALCLRYGLKDAIVTVEVDQNASLYQVLAEAAARWLKEHLRDGIKVGLGMGRTISHLPAAFQVTKPIACSFVEVVGGAAETSGGVASYNVTSQMAELAGGRADYIYAPIIVSSKEARMALMNEPSVADALEKARQCDILMHSVGPVDTSALLYIHDYLDEKVLVALRKCGAVGDMLGRYFNDQGKPIPFSLHERIIGLDLEDVSRIPWSIVIAGGKEKVPVLKAAMAGKLLNVLITDADTARRLMD